METQDYLEMLEHLVRTLGEEKVREILRYWQWAHEDIDTLLVYTLGLKDSK
jgi:uncharacterized membrane protein